MLTAIDADRRPPSLRVVESVLSFLSCRSKGRRLSLRGAEVIGEGERVVVRRARESCDRRSIGADPDTVPLSVPSTVYWPGTGQEIHVQEMTRQQVESFLKHRTPDCAVFDMTRLSQPLALRPWQAGDRIHPRGMGGKSKKLQDFFTDLKVSRQDRMQIPLLAAPEGILWVVGRREDERFVARKNTSRYLVATVHSHVKREGAE
jgi:tRNA(Ile)-lysidine synthase